MHFEPGQTVGIDLGTTFSTIAVLNQDVLRPLSQTRMMTSKLRAWCC